MAAILVLFGGLQASGAPWREVKPEERALSTPAVDPTSGAEYLFVDIEADDHFDSRDLLVTTYSRLKVYDATGIERARLQEIVIPADALFESMSARVIHPDGTIAEVSGKDIHEREVARRGNLRRRLRSFAAPGLVPGSIIDLRFDTRRRDTSLHGIPWILNQDFPARQVRLRIRPSQVVPYALSYRRTGGAELRDDRDGYKLLQLDNVHERPVEPLGVPYLNRLSWVLVSYRTYGSSEGDYWRELSGSLHELSRERIKGRYRTVREKAAALTAGAVGDEERLRRIYAFCVREIRNREHDIDTLTRRELERLAELTFPDETLKRGEGLGWQINQLFASLAAAAGFEVSYGRAGDRAILLFERSMTNWLGLPEHVVVVETAAGRRFFNPGDRFVPFGQLSWEHEGGPVALAHPENERLEIIPPTGAEQSVVTRRARLALAEDGTLEGEVEIGYAGHWSPLAKERADGYEGDALSDLVATDVARALPRGQVSSVSFENVADPLEPPLLRFHLRVPGYAEATGSRLFLEVNPFESQGEAPGTKDVVLRDYPTHTAQMEDFLARLPRLEAPTRERGVYVPFGATVVDDIQIRLPASHALDRPAAPRGVVDSPAFRHATGLAYDGAGHTLQYRRELRMVANLIPAEAYPAVRELLTRINEQDNHAIVLRTKDSMNASP